MFWASLVAQLINNLPAMQKIWVQFLSWEDSLEESMATHTSILAWRIPMAGYSSWDCKESDMTEQLSTTQHSIYVCFYCNLWPFSIWQWNSYMQINIILFYYLPCSKKGFEDGCFLRTRIKMGHFCRMQVVPKCSESVSHSSHVWLFATPWIVDCQAPLSMGFPRQEYWSGLPFPSPGYLPNPEIKPRYPALQADSLPSEPPGKSGNSSKVLLKAQK